MPGPAPPKARLYRMSCDPCGGTDCAWGRLGDVGRRADDDVNFQPGDINIRTPRRDCMVDPELELTDCADRRRLLLHDGRHKSNEIIDWQRAIETGDTVE